MYGRVGFRYLHGDSFPAVVDIATGIAGGDGHAGGEAATSSLRRFNQAPSLTQWHQRERADDAQAVQNLLPNP
jgi:hypothetical protein